MVGGSGRKGTVSPEQPTPLLAPKFEAPVRIVFSCSVAGFSKPWGNNTGPQICRFLMGFLWFFQILKNNTGPQIWGYLMAFPNFEEKNTAVVFVPGSEIRSTSSHCLDVFRAATASPGTVPSAAPPVCLLLQDSRPRPFSMARLLLRPRKGAPPGVLARRERAGSSVAGPRVRCGRLARIISFTEE